MEENREPSRSGFDLLREPIIVDDMAVVLNFAPASPDDEASSCALNAIEDILLAAYLTK